MLSLLGAALGFGTSIIPSILDLFQQKQKDAQELKMLDWKIANGLMTRKELLLYFNPDMSDEELEMKLNEVKEEKTADMEAEKEAKEASQPAFEGLRKLGTVGS